ncbi:MAG: diphthine synthase [Candidatus Nanoarchaeia archaeon]
MTLYMIGLGLGDVKDITLKGIEAALESEYLFLESYTSIYASPKEELEKFFEKTIIDATRDLVEKRADKILEHAKESNVAFLVIGDVFGATTHTDLFLRAKKEGINVIVINNASIINAVSITGLELYRFGRTASIVFDDDNWLPETPYEIIKENKKLGLHTLCLLDIKTAEPSKENLRKGIDKPEPARFLTINHALEILKKIEQKKANDEDEDAKNKKEEKVIDDEIIVIGVARLGAKDQEIKAGPLKEIINFDFGKPLHSLIIPGKLHDIEKEMLELWK